MKIAATIAIGGAAGLAVAAAGAVGAGTVDDAFLSRSRGIAYDSPQQAVSNGHEVCWYLAAGKSGTDVAMMVLSQTNLTPSWRLYSSSTPPGPSARSCPASSSHHSKNSLR